ncbi:MAG: metallophosphoesterase family protein, partial [Candidatus Hydrogenedentes bacterium]|nr:metallophosphoesterase family protein [Candidatus Hydrogenedentota bacterium]
MSVPSNSILSRLIVACVLAASAYGQDAAVIGPYVQDVRSTAATICWATRSGETKLTGPSGESIVREYSMHKTVLPRLKPGTKYQYSVEADGNVPLTGEFTTFPEKDEPFRFVVFGDTRSRHEIHARLVKRIADEKPLFVINTGDLVSDGRSMADWEKFFEVSGGLMRTIPYYPVLGNHENDSQHYYDFFCLPGNERYYTFHAGGVLFLMLDTEGPEVEVPAYVPEAEEDVFVTEQLRPYMET